MSNSEFQECVDSDLALLGAWDVPSIRVSLESRGSQSPGPASGSSDSRRWIHALRSLVRPAFRMVPRPGSLPALGDDWHLAESKECMYELWRGDHREFELALRRIEPDPDGFARLPGRHFAYFSQSLLAFSLGVASMADSAGSATRMRAARWMSSFDPEVQGERFESNLHHCNPLQRFLIALSLSAIPELCATSPAPDAWWMRAMLAWYPSPAALRPSLKRAPIAP